MAANAINVGLVGQKFMGKAHSNAYLKVAKFFDVDTLPVMKAVCGRHEAELAAFAKRFGWQSYETSWQKLVERKDVDVIDISAPSNVHHDIAVAAAKAGKHVFCEKPLAFNLAEARAMLAAVRRAGVVHMVRQMFLVTGPPVALVLVVAVAFAEPILRLLYGETYIAYASGMRLMAIFYALWYSFWPIQSALKALEKTRPIFFAGIAALIAMATVGVWAILRWGVYGTIVGQALSALILSVVLWATWLRWVQASRRETSSARASPSS